MVLALKRSAYSTNIKTRSDFSCAFFDAELRSVAQGFAQPVHLGSMVEQVPQAVRRYGAGEPPPRRRHRHERPAPERRAPERRQPDLARLRRRTSCSATSRTSRTTSTSAAARPPRSARSARCSRRASSSRPSGSSPAARSSTTSSGSILAQIRSKHETAGDFRAQIAANATGVRRVQALVARHGRDDAPRDDGRAARVHGATHARGDRAAAARRLRGRGHGRQRRLHRRAGPPARADRDRPRRRLASTRPARTRSGARRSTRPTR